MKNMNEKSEFLGKDNIRKLLWKLSVPVIVGLLVQALYNVVDTFYVGLVYGADSVQAIGGLSIAFPIQMIIMAFGIVLGTGGSSIISRALGARENEKAEKVLGNVFSLSLILSVIMAVFCLHYLDPILKVFGATPGVLPYARDYLSYIIMGGTVFVFGVATQNIVRAEGNSHLAMTAMILGGGLNIFLDPVFMFGLGMGVKGAAIATVISQTIASAWLLLYYIKGKGAVRFRSETLKPDLKIIKEIAAIGTGSFIMECSNSIMMIFVYNALAVYGGDVAIAVFGVVMKINSFVFMTLLGMAFGLQPVVGFNYGAKKYERIVEAVKISLVATTTFGLFGLLIINLLKEQLLGLFSTDPAYLKLGENAIMVMLLGTPLIGMNIITSTVFQALGKAKPAFLLSISRQLLFLIPSVVLLPRLYQLDGVWKAFPVSDTLAFLFSGFMLWRLYKIYKENKGSSKASTGSETADKRSPSNSS
jgi:putative MATE family efflux protein